MYSVFEKTIRLLVTAVVLFALLFGCAFGEAVPSKAFFDNAKQALLCLANDQPEDALSYLNFSFTDPSYSNEGFLSFVEENFILDHVQTNVAACYYDDADLLWKLAIPVAEPANDSVKVLVLSSADMVTYSGYSMATWSDVQKYTTKTDWVWWNKEYVNNGVSIFAD